jgi:ribonuclease BN (tRNA processing enzyme)
MKNFQTNALIEFDSGYKLLIDCGGDIRFALAEAGYSYLDVNGVYVSHLHNDHIGGMEHLAFASYFDPRYQGRPDLYISEFMVDDLWNRALSAGLASLQNKRANLETYFDVHAIPKNGSFYVGGTDFRLIQMIHFVNGFTFELSFGLMFKVLAETIFMTTDTQHAPNQIQDFYNEATIVFHDCETTPFASGVHAHIDELATLDEETKAKLHLVHYQDNVVDEWSTANVNARNRGFAMYVEKGQTFEF